jgi:hypothetical protein
MLYSQPMKTLILVLLLCTPLTAQNWELFTRSANETVYLDLSTMSGDRSGKQMWFKFVPRKKAKYDHQVMLLWFHCGEKSYRVKQAVWYSAKGTALKSVDSSKELDIVPGTLMAELYPLLCINR